mmetsp:Transcript_17892/g.43031  ORF Transcript_17892/g.43031 Transcript_17892/m.43031 type:complete len:203 (+) Transcript_17892:405-1013(+)
MAAGAARHHHLESSHPTPAVCQPDHRLASHPDPTLRPLSKREIRSSRLPGQRCGIDPTVQLLACGRVWLFLPPLAARVVWGRCCRQHYTLGRGRSCSRVGSSAWGRSPCPRWADTQRPPPAKCTPTTAGTTSTLRGQRHDLRHKRGVRIRMQPSMPCPSRHPCSSSNSSSMPTSLTHSPKRRDPWRHTGSSSSTREGRCRRL